MPGLVNSHLHAAMSLFRGLADGLPLQAWLEEHMFPAEGKWVNEEFVYWGTLLTCAEMIRSGTTAFSDGYFFEDQAARAALRSGMRALVAQGILDFPTPDSPSPVEAIKRIERFDQGLFRFQFDKTRHIRPHGLHLFTRSSKEVPKPRGAIRRSLDHASFRNTN